jgi:hypothetical protein
MPLGLLKAASGGECNDEVCMKTSGQVDEEDCRRTGSNNCLTLPSVARPSSRNELHRMSDSPLSKLYPHLLSIF